jgi:histidinol-phosphatase
MTDIQSGKFLLKLRKDAEAIARTGGNSTMNYFKRSFELEFKDDESPVTNADREAEQIIRELIKRKYPDHGIIGEEFGEAGKDRDVVWVIDPIDGTQSFIHGVPFYTTLIGILIEGVPKVGVIYAPALNELVSAAAGSGAFLNGSECKTRICNELTRATFLSTDVENVKKYHFTNTFKELLDKTRIHRTWGDAYGQP